MYIAASHPRVISFIIAEDANGSIGNFVSVGICTPSRLDTLNLHYYTFTNTAICCSGSFGGRAIPSNFHQTLAIPIKTPTFLRTSILHVSMQYTLPNKPTSLHTRYLRTCKLVRLHTFATRYTRRLHTQHLNISIAHTWAFHSYTSSCCAAFGTFNMLQTLRPLP